MKIELTIDDLPDGILEKITNSERSVDDGLTPMQHFLDWLEEHLQESIEQLYEDSDVSEDVEAPSVYAKELK